MSVSSRCVSGAVPSSSQPDARLLPAPTRTSPTCWPGSGKRTVTWELQSQVSVCQVHFPLPAGRMLGSRLHQQGPVQLAGQDQVRGRCYMRASPSLLTFKAKLKSHLFRQALQLICTHLLLSCLILSPSVFWWRMAQARSLWTSTNTVHLTLHASCCWCHRTSGDTWKQLFNMKASCSCRRCDKGWVLQELEKIVLAATVYEMF